MATLVSVEEYLHTSFQDGDREYVDGRLVETNVGDFDHARLQLRIGSYLLTHYDKVLRAATAARVQITRTRFRVPDVVAVLASQPRERIITEAPFIVVEIVSPDDRVDELEDKIQDYLQLGIPNIWVVNPRSQRVSIRTVDGAREVRDGVLRTQDPAIEIPLAEIFAE